VLSALACALLFGVTGVLPAWAPLTVALTVTVGLAAAAGVGAALGITAPSLGAAQKRAFIYVFAPPLVVSAAHWCLPRLAGLEVLSLPHILSAGLAGVGSSQFLIGATLHLAVGLAAVLFTTWAIRIRPELTDTR
jgi:hypothetical protein